MKSIGYRLIPKLTRKEKYKPKDRKKIYPEINQYLFETKKKEKKIIKFDINTTQKESIELELVVVEQVKKEAAIVPKKIDETLVQIDNIPTKIDSEIILDTAKGEFTLKNELNSTSTITKVDSELVINKLTINNADQTTSTNEQIIIQNQTTDEKKDRTIVTTIENKNQNNNSTKIEIEPIAPEKKIEEVGILKFENYQWENAGLQPQNISIFKSSYLFERTSDATRKFKSFLKRKKKSTKYRKLLRNRLFRK
jgi:hypothetical protein